MAFAALSVNGSITSLFCFPSNAAHVVDRQFIQEYNPLDQPTHLPWGKRFPHMAHCLIGGPQQPTLGIG
jgi:hypothetical protein